MMRYPRDEAIKHLTASGFKKSRPAHAGEMWRNSHTGERVIVPSGDVDERNFRQILKACNKTDEEAKQICDGLTPKQSTVNGSTH